MREICSEKCLEKSVAIFIVIDREVCRAADVHHGLDSAGVFREGWVGIVAGIQHPEQGSELSASRVAECADVAGIDIVLCGVGANPTHTTLYVVQLRWPAILGAVEEAVVDGKRHKARASQELTHALHGALVEADPTAAVDENYGWTRMIQFPAGLVDIKQKRLTVQ